MNNPNNTSRRSSSYNKDFKYPVTVHKKEGILHCISQFFKRIWHKFFWWRFFMICESELSKAKAECDKAFKAFMEMNVLFAEHRQDNSTVTEENFFNALRKFHTAYEKYTQLQNSNIWREWLCDVYHSKVSLPNSALRSQRRNIFASTASSNFRDIHYSQKHFHFRCF